MAERDLGGAAAARAGGGLAQHAHRLRVAGGIALVVMDGDALGVSAGRGEQLPRRARAARARSPAENSA